MNQLLQFFQDEQGALSATRLAFLATIFAVIGEWVYMCYYSKELLPLPSSIVYLVGILMVGKVSQSFVDNKSPSVPPVP